MKTWHIVALLILASFVGGVVSPIQAAPSGMTFTVTSLADNPDAAPGNGTCADRGGGCTLRAAIMEANALAGANTIVLLADTYHLTRAGADEDAASTGDLDITGALTISGASPATTIIDASDSGDRVFQILHGAHVTISGMTMSGGTNFYALAGIAGGIYNSGVLDITNCVIEDNEASSTAGGIYNKGQLLITNSIIRHNAAQKGGGIYNAGTLTLTTSTISSNTVTGNGGGIYNGGTASIDASTIVMNTADYLGGGIDTEGRVRVTNSTVAGNSAAHSGGGISFTYHAANSQITNTSIRANSANLGGGLYPATPVSVDSSTISDNTATIGGGVYVDNGGALDLSDSTIRDNTTTSGGGAGLFVNRLASASIRSSTLNRNRAVAAGGGILMTGTAVVQLASSTLSDNLSASSGGGIQIEGGRLDTFNVTLAGNIADFDGDSRDQGGGISQTGGTVGLRNTILAANYHVDYMFLVRDDCHGTIAILYYSLLSATANCRITTNTASLTDQPAGLLALADNGGPTLTHALRSGSPAIDRADSNGCKDAANRVLKYDQRRYFRAIDGDGDSSPTCDMGAYEYGSTAPYTYLPIVLRSS